MVENKIALVGSLCDHIALPVVRLHLKRSNHRGHFCDLLCDRIVKHCATT